MRDKSGEVDSTKTYVTNDRASLSALNGDMLLDMDQYVVQIRMEDKLIRY
jgi:hypothetical protein